MSTMSTTMTRMSLATYLLTVALGSGLAQGQDSHLFLLGGEEEEDSRQVSLVVLLVLVELDFPEWGEVSLAGVWRNAFLFFFLVVAATVLKFISLTYYVPNMGISSC
jgi:hypothetical protein